MNCTICGMRTSQDALLCRPCKAALKRARQLTVQDVPRVRPRAAARRTHRGPPAEPLHRTNARGRPGKSDNAARMLLGAVAFAALAGAVYIAERAFAERAANARTPPAIVAHAPDPAPADVAVARDVAVASTPVQALTPEPAPAPHRLQTPVAAPTRTASATPATTARPSGETGAARRQERPVAEAATYPALDSFGPIAEAPKPLPPPPDVAPRAPPPPDRWQLMSEALSRCANEGWWSGFICGQRVRLASCDGYWGRVAQCPSPPENPR